MAVVLDKYGEWTIEDAIAGLENFRSTIGYCDLSEYLGVAIDCMGHVLESVKERDDT